MLERWDGEVGATMHETTFEREFDEALDRYEQCADCRHYDPAWLKGWAANGRILRRHEGICTILRCVVDETLPCECDVFERIP